MITGSAKPELKMTTSMLLDANYLMRTNRASTLALELTSQASQCTDAVRRNVLHFSANGLNGAGAAGCKYESVHARKGIRIANGAPIPRLAPRMHTIKFGGRRTLEGSMLGAT